MKIIVTHTSPDWDAITSVWLIKTFLAGWQDAKVEFVQAGTKSSRLDNLEVSPTDVIVRVGEVEIIHVDTGLMALDHHQTSSQEVCAATRTWDYIQQMFADAKNELKPEHKEAVSRIVGVVLQDDHFREVFWADPMADYHEFSLVGLLEGMKLTKPNQDEYYLTFGMECLNALVHTFEGRIWAEKEISENGISFPIKAGKAIAFETLNDNVIKLSQKMGYLLVVRKDPRKGYVRIKLRPSTNEVDNLDLTPAYEKLHKIDPKATWFLHVSKKMLLNGTSKNPGMVATSLSLEQIIDVLKNLY